MIAFATLFLGLVVGLHPVAVTVRGAVVSVEIEVDGSPAGRMEASPWKTVIDLGPELAPHELVARALDGKGREIARARQWLNLPRPAAELQILLQRDEKGIVTGAQLGWESLLPGPPSSLAVTFDGHVLAVKGRDPFDVPGYDPSTTHLLSATAEFENGIRCRADSVLGGRTAIETGSALTAIPVSVAAGRALPDAEALEGMFVRRGVALRTVAIERGPAQVLVVRDVSEMEALARLGRGGKTFFEPSNVRRGVLPQYDSEASKLVMRLGDEDRIRILWPVMRRTSTESGLAELYETSHEFAGKGAGIHWLLTRIARPGKVDPERHFADATAVAGLQALQSSTRRAVVLVLGKNPEDASRLSPATVRAYFERIRVPLFVWSLDGSRAGATGPWGEVTDISSVARLKPAVERLKQALDDQAIVWVEGRHLPQEIALSRRAEGLEMVR
jgi:hypothetical protein